MLACGGNIQSFEDELGIRFDTVYLQVGFCACCGLYGECLVHLDGRRLLIVARSEFDDIACCGTVYSVVDIVAGVECYHGCIGRECHKARCHKKGKFFHIISVFIGFAEKGP